MSPLLVASVAPAPEGDQPDADATAAKPDTSEEEQLGTESTDQSSNQEQIDKSATCTAIVEGTTASDIFSSSGEHIAQIENQGDLSNSFAATKDTDDQNARTSEPFHDLSDAKDSWKRSSIGEDYNEAPDKRSVADESVEDEGKDDGVNGRPSVSADESEETIKREQDGEDGQKADSSADNASKQQQQDDMKKGDKLCDNKEADDDETCLLANRKRLVNNISAHPYERTVLDSDRMQTVRELDDDRNNVNDDCSHDVSIESWMNYRSSSTEGDVLPPVPVPSRDTSGEDDDQQDDVNGVHTGGCNPDVPPVQAVPAPPEDDGDERNIPTAPIVYPVPVPVGAASGADNAADATCSAAAAAGSTASFPDLLQEEDGRRSTGNITTDAEAKREARQSQFSSDRDINADWLRDDVAIAQEIDPNHKRSGSDAFRNGMAKLRKSVDKGSIARARRAALSSIASMDTAMSKLLKDESLAGTRLPGSSAPPSSSSVAIETKAGPMLPRIPLPSEIKFNDATSQWIATIHTDQKSLDKGMNTLAARGVVTMSFASEKEVREATTAFAPPRHLPFKNSPVCFICLKKFKVFKRAGHCRNCGVCVCHKCSTTWPSAGLPSTLNIKNESLVRMCNVCDWLSSSFRTALLAGRQDEAVAIHATGNVNLRSPFVNVKGETLYPIHCAALGGSVDILKWLVDERCCPITSSPHRGKRGSGVAADVSPLLTSKGRSILDIAVGNQNVDMLRYIVVEKNVSVLGIKDFRSSLLALDAVLRRLPEETPTSNTSDIDTRMSLNRLESLDSSSNQSQDNSCVERSRSVPSEQQDVPDMNAMMHLSHYEEMQRSKSC